MEANVAYYCLHKFGWEPDKVLKMSGEEQAFIKAAIDIKLENEEKQRRKAERDRS